MASGRQIGRVITANAVPDLQVSPDLLRQLDDEKAIPTLGLLYSRTTIKIVGDPQE